MRARVNPDAYRSNKYEVACAGIPLTVVELGELASTISVLVLADGQRVTAGQSRGGETDLMVRQSDEETVVFCDEWALEASDDGGVAPTYRRPVTVTHFRIGGESQSFLLVNAWISERKIPGVKMSEDGAADDQIVTYKLQYDDVQRL